MATSDDLESWSEKFAPNGGKRRKLRIRQLEEASRKPILDSCVVRFYATTKNFFTLLDFFCSEAKIVRAGASSKLGPTDERVRQRKDVRDEKKSLAWQRRPSLNCFSAETAPRKLTPTKAWEEDERNINYWFVRAPKRDIFSLFLFTERCKKHFYLKPRANFGNFILRGKISSSYAEINLGIKAGQ